MHVQLMERACERAREREREGREGIKGIVRTSIETTMYLWSAI